MKVPFMSWYMIYLLCNRESFVTHSSTTRIMVAKADSICQQSVGIIGAGAAGLITGYTLLRDGFPNVQLLTRDKSAGGVWARERIYPGVSINK